MYNLKKIVALGCGLLSFYGLSAELVNIENNNDNEYKGAFVYVTASGKVSPPDSFFTILRRKHTEQPMPSKSLTGKYRYLIVTSDVQTNPTKFDTRNLDTVDRINDTYDTNIIQIGRGGLTGPKQNRITVTATRGSSKPVLKGETF